MTMIATRNGKNAQKIEKTKFGDEKELQEYIYENPEVIPMYEIDEDIKVVILMREFQTRGGGRIDAMGVDEYGNIYIIETKLYKNPDKKLVLSQVLDYGASIWSYYNDFSEFLSILDEGTHKKFNMGVKDKLTEFFQLEQEEELNELLDNIKQNLNKGIFKFVVLMDELEDRLKDLILFINKNSQFDIYAVEIEYYKFESNELMIPKIFGNEVKKDIDVASSSRKWRKWTEELFFDELKANVQLKYFQEIKKVYDYFKNNADRIKWGTGNVKGSFNVSYEKICPRSVLTIWSDGCLTINYGWLDSPDSAVKFRDRLKEEFARKYGTDVNERWNNYSIEEWVGNADWLISVVSRIIKDLDN